MKRLILAILMIFLVAASSTFTHHARLNTFPAIDVRALPGIGPR